jgi:hypothetical protein
LSKINAPVYTSVHGFDVSEDGRFLFTRYADTPPPPATHIHVIENWLEELKQKVPAQR